MVRMTIQDHLWEVLDSIAFGVLAVLSLVVTAISLAALAYLIALFLFFLTYVVWWGVALAVSLALLYGLGRIASTL